MYTADDSSQEKIGATKQPARHCGCEFVFIRRKVLAFQTMAYQRAENYQL